MNENNKNKKVNEKPEVQVVYEKVITGNGMTKEEILISEKEYGTNIINTFENESDPYYNPTGYSYSLGYNISNAILGYQSSNIIFYFDNEDKLMSLSYGLGVGNDSGVTASEAYDETKILLIDKYGDPYSTNKIISEDLVTTALSEDIYATELFRAFGENSYVRNVCQWLVKYCDCYVLIDLYIEKPFSDYDESCKLAYRMIPMNIGEKLENEKMRRRRNLQYICSEQCIFGAY